jgi:hypothetical protein
MDFTECVVNRKHKSTLSSIKHGAGRLGRAVMIFHPFYYTNDIFKIMIIDDFVLIALRFPSF